MSRSISLRRSPKPGAFDREHRHGAAELVDDQRREGLAVDVLGDDDHRLALSDGLLERREHVLDARDLLVGDQDERVLEDRFHAVGVGDEVRREVAAVELHALRVLGLEAERLALLDGDDAVLADLVHHLGDDRADLGIGGADRRHGRDLLAVVDRARLALELGDDRLDALLDAALDGDRVGPGADVLEALGDDRLAEDDGGRGAVAGDVVGLGGDFLEELGAHVLERVLELDLLGDRHPVVGDRGRAVLLVEDDVAALRPERDADGVGETVDAVLEAPPGHLVEEELLGHGVCCPFRVWPRLRLPRATSSKRSCLAIAASSRLTEARRQWPESAGV